MMTSVRDLYKYHNLKANTCEKYVLFYMEKGCRGFSICINVSSCGCLIKYLEMSGVLSS